MALRAEQLTLGLSSLLAPGIVRIALELGAAETGGDLTPPERKIVREALAFPKPSAADLELVRRLFREGRDPLGDAFCRVVPPAERRPLGAVYTPPTLVRPMVAWVLDHHPARVVDMGCGSGRFTVAVAQAAPDVEVVAVDLDPVATLVCRANSALAGSSRVRVVQGDYTRLNLPAAQVRTAFLGNPPYVRHHGLSVEAKAWAKRTAKELGLAVSSLAGLHVHFYLATARYARPGDVGCLVTSAEWLDVGYGATVRELLAGSLGASALHLIDPKSQPFGDTMTTAVIAAFEVGETSGPIRFRFLHDGAALGDLAEGGRAVDRAEARSTPRWSRFFAPDRAHGGSRTARAAREANLVPLGSLFRVSRGVATGCNGFFVMTRSEAKERGLETFARPALTSAKELLASPGSIRATPERKVLIDIPKVLDPNVPAGAAALAYIREGERRQVHDRYLCQHRQPWWSLGVGPAPRAVATYMARQAPAFATNPDGLVLLNIAHGFYPKGPMTDEELAAIVHYLNSTRLSYCGEGRTYHGGLEKFEPREMEALPVPSVDCFRSLPGEVCTAT